LGGGVALRYAGIYPENILKMVVIEGTGGPPSEFYNRPVHERMREWIDNTRKTSGRSPKKYPTLEDAYQRMHEVNNYLREDQARYLTIHGTNQNEDGTYSWKFDNYTHVFQPFDMTRDQVKELWGRIDAPVLFLSGTESWFAEHHEDPMPYFKNGKQIQFENAGHWLHHDQLDNFLSVTREFLNA
ncbi:alpha/beta hydrolase, partial [Parvibaculum sp.]|uniref:alpha/beta fold hydrolase n=1 Tax=Parvibaculum sp. TaxID=2024848 RepID=UPI001AFCE309